MSLGIPCQRNSDPPTVLPQLNQIFEIVWHKQTAFGCRLAQLIQFRLKLLCGEAAPSESFKIGNGLLDDFWRLMDKLQPEIFNAVFSPAVEPIEIQLNLRIEDCIATPDIC